MTDAIHGKTATSYDHTESPRYNDSVCYQRFCCKIEFAIIKRLDMDPSKARIMDTFEGFLMNHTYYILVRITSVRRF